MEMLNLNLHSTKARKSHNPTKPCNPSNRETGPLPALGRVRPLLVIWVLVAMGGGCVPLHARAEGVRFLDNGEVRIGIDLAIGGAITHFGRSGTDENLINSHDWGRQVQMSFYSGPSPFEPDGQKPTPHWAGLGWNPIQSGDYAGNQSEVLAFEAKRNELYVKCRPMHWPLDNVPGECVFESWISLDGMTAEVRSKITNARPDKTLYPAREQELPAVYTNGPYYRLVTYTGDEPFTGGTLETIPQRPEGGFPWTHFHATERWAALLNDAGWGVGVWSPESVLYVGGFAGKPGAGGPKDAPTGYISPLNVEALDHNIEYEYRYTLILGSEAEIRAHAAKHAPEAPPRWEFDGSRAHWYAKGMTEAGWPIGKSWDMTITETGAAVFSPVTFWRAEDTKLLVIEGDFPQGTGARVCWKRHGAADFDTEHALVLAPEQLEGGKCRIALTARPGYEGGMSGLRIEFPDAAAGAPLRLKRVVLYDEDPVAKWSKYYETQRRLRAERGAFGFAGGVRR